MVPAICTSANSSMNVVAHEDDDILFMDPPTYTDVAAGRCLTTVYLTAGDDGQGASYWHGREDGAMAAYAKMARHQATPGRRRGSKPHPARQPSPAR